MKIRQLIIPLMVTFLVVGCTVEVVENCDVSGCTNSEALNFNAAATVDDGSCMVDNLTGSWTMSGWYTNTSTTCEGDATSSTQIDQWGGSSIITFSNMSYQNNLLDGSVTITDTDDYGYVTTYTGSCSLSQSTLSVTYTGNNVPYPTSFTLAVSDNSTTVTGELILNDKCNQYTFTKNQ